MLIRTVITIASLALFSGVAQAEDLTIPRNAKILSADGAALGRVDRVIYAGETVSAVQLIFGGKMVVIPANTLTVDGKEVKTSLSKKDVRSLK